MKRVKAIKKAARKMKVSLHSKLKSIGPNRKNQYEVNHARRAVKAYSTLSSKGKEMINKELKRDSDNTILTLLDL